MTLSNRSKTILDDLPLDLVAQVLLRIPAHPRILLTVTVACPNWRRLTVACPNWRRLIRSHDFRELSMSHHGGTLLLGFFFYRSGDSDCLLSQSMFLTQTSCQNCHAWINTISMRLAVTVMVAYTEPYVS
jgi:hypothetical protein